MKVVLFALGVGTVFLGFAVTHGAESVMHLILGGLYLLIAAVFLSAAMLCDHLETVLKKSQQKIAKDEEA